MIVGQVSCEGAPEMRLIQDDHVIETLAPNGSDQTFDVGILPRTRRSAVTDSGRDLDGRGGLGASAWVVSDSPCAAPGLYRVDVEDVLRTWGHAAYRGFERRPGVNLAPL